MNADVDCARPSKRAKITKTRSSKTLSNASRGKKAHIITKRDLATLPTPSTMCGSDEIPTFVSEDTIVKNETHQLSLLDIPSEIIDHIVSYLDYGYTIKHTKRERHTGFLPAASEDALLRLPNTALFALSWTCRILHSYARPLLCAFTSSLEQFHEIQTHPYFGITVALRHDANDCDFYEHGRCMSDKTTAYSNLVQELQDMEKWPAYDPDGRSALMIRWPGNISEQDAMLDRFASKIKPQNLFVCAGCLRFRRIHKFAFAQITGRHGKRPKSSQAAHQAHLRFCIDCGMGKGGGYTRGKLYRFFEHDIRDKPDWAIICSRCGKWKVCKKGKDSAEALTKECDDCRAYRPKGRQPDTSSNTEPPGPVP
ncbi:MAG: hypothetical protein M1828_002536 [Chrysothrix sp. TS-e1954]|nr:MAG: hypothetical protein M1828_002536 [Chrysothrix sp. TS-e1954]